MKILYLLNRFPVISQTFILNEITRLLDYGHDLSIISLVKEDSEKVHNNVIEYDLVNKTTYLKFFSQKNELTMMNLLKKVIKDTFKNKMLTQKEKFTLLKSCYNTQEDVGVASRKFLSCLEIIKVIKEKKIEHIHCHFARRNVNIAYRINKVIGVPYTFTTHAHDIFINPAEDFKKWSMGAEKVISISEFNKKYMHDHFDLSYEKMEVIPCSNYLDKLTPVLDYQSNHFKIVTISRLIEKKGYPYLIEACKILKDKGVEFSCEIQGNGPQKAELERLISKNNLGKDITLGGVIKHDEVLDFIRSGSVFVLPCIRGSDNNMDGIPTVLMESMAMEIPTISTDITGIPELIDDSVNGVIVPQNDSAALADAILKIKEDPGFAEKIRKKSREKVANKFNVEKNVKKLIEVFLKK